MPTLRQFLDVATRLSTADLNRSENDLSSTLKGALEHFGLHGVLDTSSGDDPRRRPDIALYVDLDAADLGGPAEIIVEAKKPAEVHGFVDLRVALANDSLWNQKFVPYVSAHLERLHFFILTTFREFLVVPISDDVRNLVRSGGAIPMGRRLHILSRAYSFDISEDAREFLAWCEHHLTPGYLEPLPLSRLLDLRSLRGADDLEQFANQLADLVAGPEGRPVPGGALLGSISLETTTLDELQPGLRSTLVVYTMSTNGGLSVEGAERYLRAHLRQELAEFISVSVHSLVGRLFSIKVIEDGFCIGVTPPLIPETHWIFHSTRFDASSPSELPVEVFSALDDLADAGAPAVRDFSTVAKFYDWLAPFVQPGTFRRLLELFFVNNFSSLDGDLLGRFFELYAQRVDKRRRRTLGQYYTPAPIVRFLWTEALQIVEEHDALDDLIVLDPGVGSGTFLIEGARRLSDAGMPRFWERLFGFDIAPQVIGVAQVNLYLTVLGLMTRQAADEVASLGLYPTDTLDPRNGARLQAIMTLLTDEAILTFIRHRIEMSEHVKRPGQFPLVLGNPPYRHNPERTLSQMADVFPTLLRSSRDNSKAQENAIREDYAWFFAAADYYLRDRGVIAFVVSDSFCYARSFRYFREDLLRRYRVRSLVHLGRFLFRDVGPRISFITIVLERRAEDLADAAESGEISYVDMRPLIIAGDPSLGTDADPRFLALDTGNLPEPVPHTPSRLRAFSLLPAGEVVAKVLRWPTKLIDAQRRVFVKKWPGAVTGFDKLFKSKDRDALSARMQALFLAANEESGEGPLGQLSIQCRMNDDEAAKLANVATQIREKQLGFDEARIRRALTGSASDDCSWYPDYRMQTWVYYEPRILFERAVHEGRTEGWGTSNQWRDQASHGVSPKLVFTTSTNPEAGLKAFVLTDDWLVLKAAATRQQLNYTACRNPLTQAELAPNNLGGDVLPFFSALEHNGYGEEDFLLYIAALYNSQTASDYLQEGGDNALRVPLSLSAISDGSVGEIISLARKTRDIRRLSTIPSPSPEGDEALAVFSPEDLAGLGFRRETIREGRFRAETVWRRSDETALLLETAVAEASEAISTAVRELFDRDIE